MRHAHARLALRLLLLAASYAALPFPPSSRRRGRATAPRRHIRHCNVVALAVSSAVAAALHVPEPRSLRRGSARSASPQQQLARRPRDVRASEPSASPISMPPRVAPEHASHRIDRSDACAASFTAGHHPADRPRIARSARCARRASGARGLPERRAAHRNARDSRRNSRRNRLRTTRRRTLPLTPSQAERPFRDARRLKNRVPATRQAPCEVRSASQPQATPAHCRARRSEHGAHHSTIRPVV
ncbi:Uncharacterised protein [Burkholderia pseudomallei]|nr:Uncharacterised protein [Burkholderia pseudomallei]CAJ4118193.1 Uncharacterised protein [Burkholderia pseudomallei]CAJ4546640.1 Uncharacterised protein [Burkholderia pseudomallei]CAJ6228612.1 Uncharacterised protein [Burkholderia pseudomallei]CAJ6240050.1 Uncharacterised protein [Burkholderia pseudomallei]